MLIPFIEAIEKEYHLYSKISDFNAIRTVYFGGGTPNTIPPDFLFKILPERIITQSEEVTLEINPGVFSGDTINEYLHSGVNRISVGIQSFDNRDLKVLGRIHNAEEALNTLELLKSRGFNINVDLIYGIPHQSLQRWESNLQKLLSFQPEHISLYALSIEEGTPFCKMYKSGEIKIPDENQYYRYYSLACRFLEENDYEHYEISNWSKRNFASVHNSAYWTGDPYLGLGPSAHSLDGSNRWWNVSNLKEYLGLLEEGKLPVENRESLTTEQIFLERIYTGLRTETGFFWNEIFPINGFNIDKITGFLRKKYEPRDRYFKNLDEEKIVLTETGWWFHEEICGDIARFLPENP